MRTKIRTYTELSELDSFEDRFEYLKLSGSIGKETFGYDRYLNQRFYNSVEWKKIRDQVILRDLGCDLACEDREIYGKILIHHMNPLLPKDIIHLSEYVMNPEYLITTTHETHNAIHYGDISILTTRPVERTKNDTCPWRH